MALHGSLRVTLPGSGGATRSRPGCSNPASASDLARESEPQSLPTVAPGPARPAAVTASHRPPGHSCKLEYERRTVSTQQPWPGMPVTRRPRFQVSTRSGFQGGVPGGTSVVSDAAPGIPASRHPSHAGSDAASVGCSSSSRPGSRRRPLLNCRHRPHRRPPPHRPAATHVLPAHRAGRVRYESAAGRRRASPPLMGTESPFPRTSLVQDGPPLARSRSGRRPRRREARNWQEGGEERRGKRTAHTHTHTHTRRGEKRTGVRRSGGSAAGLERRGGSGGELAVTARACLRTLRSRTGPGRGPRGWSAVT